MKDRATGKRKPREVIRPRLWDDASSLARTLVLAALCNHVAAKLGGGASWGLVGVGAALVIAFLKRDLLERPGVWAILAAVLAWLSFFHSAAANHTYLLFYLALAMALCSALMRPADQAAGAAFNARLLLVCVMAFAVAQKSVSADFRDGSYLSYLLLTGKVGELAWRAGVAPQARAAQLRNQARETNFKPTSKTYASESFEFENPFGQWLSAIVVALAVTILLSETLLAIAFAWRPDAWPAHALLIAFGAMLVFIRPEAMFMATLLSLGALVAQKNGNLRLVRIYCVAGLIANAMAIAGLPGNLTDV